MTQLPQNLDDLRAAILATWKGFENATVCDLILSRAAEFAHGEPLGYRGLAKLAEREFDDALMGAATILSSSRFSVFDMRLVVADGDGYVPLPPDTFSQASRDGWLVHPVSGERIEDWKSVVYPTLVPNEYLKSLVPVAPTDEP